MTEHTSLRLTELANLAGCTAKSGAEDLALMLSRFAEVDGTTQPDPNVLVGLSHPDDAAVYRITPDIAVVATLDFFAPIVDDPYAYGAIAAANALSDIYAMGADPIMALNIAAFPLEMEQNTVDEILRGGADKVREAGATLVGGHTVIDEEPKYGLSAIGTIHPDGILSKSGARIGDQVFLTKPLGTGLITTAGKFQEADPEHVDRAIACMSSLNHEAARAVREVGASSLTDVTGFGLLGHGYEVAQASGVQLRIHAPSIPLLPGALEYAYRGILNGGEFRNRRYLEGKLSVAEEVSQDLQHVLFDPQTSGGLLFTVPGERQDRVATVFGEIGANAWHIGHVAEGCGLVVTN